MNSTQINEFVNEVLKKSSDIFGYNEKVHVGEFKNKNAFGLAYTRTKVVKFNRDFFDLIPEEMCKNTIIHEIAHLIVHAKYPKAKQMHGPEFRSVCLALGGNGETKTRIPENCEHLYRTRKVTKYFYSCGCDIHKLTGSQHNKFSSGRFTFTCRSCGEKIKFSGKSAKV